MERTNKERMKATKKRYLSMDVSDKSGGRLVVVEFKFVSENCAVSMTAILYISVGRFSLSALVCLLILQVLIQSATRIMKWDFFLPIRPCCTFFLMFFST